MANAKSYDARQTELTEQLRERLQSVAIQAVQAQDVIGADRCLDLLDDIIRDVQQAQKLAVKLSTDDV